MIPVYLSFGSNLGDRHHNISLALAKLDAHENIQVLTHSVPEETKALTLDNQPQPNYLNGVIYIETNLTPLALLHTLKKIEADLGRQASKKRWQPRTIDLDILLYGDHTIQLPELQIPHPELKNRPFLLKHLRHTQISLS